LRNAALQPRAADVTIVGVIGTATALLAGSIGSCRMTSSAGARVLDRLPARVHVPRDGRRRVCGRHLSPLYTRLLKALLFLGSGAVIHALAANRISGDGGLRKICRSLTGRSSSAQSRLPASPAGGFFSKDEILSARTPAGNTVLLDRAI